MTDKAMPGETMLRGLSGKTAIVTGGATMLGAAVVGALHAAGTRVVIADIDAENGNAVAARLGEGVEFCLTDITNDDQIAACVALAVERFGGVDILVNLACTYLDEGLATKRADWLAALDVNLVSMAMFIQAVRPHMIAAGGGAIVNFSSGSGKIAQTGRWVYPASKAAIEQLTRSEALDLAGDRIRVNAVSPGWTWSSVMDRATGGDRRKTDRVAGPFHMPGRIGDPEEVAQVVLFLCSANASFVTAASWAVDGGYTAMGPEGAVPSIPKLLE